MQDKPAVALLFVFVGVMF